MKCSSIMKTDVECCSGDESVETAAERMRSRNIGFLPVCDSDGSIVGTLTDRDLAVRVLAEHRAGQTSLRDVMSPELVSCSPDDDLEVAEALMMQHKKSRILCVDEDKHPVGVISLSDIARVEQATKVSEILGSIVTREAPQPQPQA